MDISKKYIEYCNNKNILFQSGLSVSPYDDSTLFCPAGMQQFKSNFIDESYRGTIANIQPCIRMNDFSEIGDSTHLLYFNMIGLFSFREMTIKDAIYFWIEFIDSLNIKPDYVTIHPDKKGWSKFYPDFIEKRFLDECVWTDGQIGGYCTEFFINDIEIGNIVNPLGNCIDVGFGLERLDLIVNNKSIDKLSSLKDTALLLIESGYTPSNTKQGYVLRKILREIYSSGGEIDNKYYHDEIIRQERIRQKYDKLKLKYSHMSKEWWFDTHGINLDDFI
jgi:alanyl-tRNA synthetase